MKDLRNDLIAHKVSIFEIFENCHLQISMPYFREQGSCMAIGVLVETQGLDKPKIQPPQKRWLGLTDFLDAYELQLSLAKTHQSDVILGLEHPLVVTGGARSKDLKNVISIDRGGELTLHSPGQLVIYPIVDIRQRWGVREWVELLTAVSEASFQILGVQVARGPHAGLWTEKGKILFMGLRIRRGINTHGLSINVCNDLSHFGNIVSCGIQNASVDSLQNLGVNCWPQEFFDIWYAQFLQLSGHLGKTCQLQKS